MGRDGEIALEIGFGELKVTCACSIFQHVVESGSITPR